MSISIRPLAEINQQATTILLREMGIADATRFMSQFMPGIGDYTADREHWLGEKSLAETIQDIKSLKSKRT